MPDQAFTLERILLPLTPNDSWTARDACEGTAIFGATGAAKTTGSAEQIALAFLREGFGGLVLTAKPGGPGNEGDIELWQRYAAMTGRSDDLILFSPNSGHCFNFLQYEAQATPEHGLTENLIAVFMTLVEVRERRRSSGGDPFWLHSLTQLLRNAINLLQLAKEPLTLPNLYQLVISAPTTPLQVVPAAELDETIDEERAALEWQRSSYFLRCLDNAFAEAVTEQDNLDVTQSRDYWLKEFCTMPSKTRGSIVVTFTSMADYFLSGMLRPLFCGDSSTVTPDATLDGKIIVVALPVLQYQELGIFANVLFKLMFQRGMLRRNIEPDTKPIFLWADEAQETLSKYDTRFQSVARSFRIATVYSAQNIDSYYHAFGGGLQATVAADSLLANLQTKIFHQNVGRTNTWAADLIGKHWDWQTGSVSLSEGDSLTEGHGIPRHDPRTSLSTRFAYLYQVEPFEFTTLRKGGPANDLFVDAIVFQGGRRWNINGRNHARCVFQQQARPQRPSPS